MDTLSGESRKVKENGYTVKGELKSKGKWIHFQGRVEKKRKMDALSGNIRKVRENDYTLKPTFIQ